MTTTEQSQPRRELRELRTLYILNPHFRDIIVEGRDDAAWINWYISEHRIPNARVYAVDDRAVVPGEVVKLFHPEINARGRVVALANEFSNWNIPSPSLTAIIDADFDLLEPTEYPSSLLTTDYAAMEVYALEQRPLSKFLLISAKANVDASTLTSLLKPAWAAMYALRYVIHRHHEGARLANKWAEKCVDNAGQIIVDVRELLRTVTPTPGKEFFDDLLGMHEHYLSKIPDSTLDGIRGHDIAPLIIRFLGFKNEFADIKYVERLLRQSLELRDLEEHDMFTNLRQRLS